MDQYRKALRAYLLRTHWVLCHPSVRGASVMAAVHGTEYTGPVWVQQPEIQEALQLAGLPAELPIPKYPQDEAGVFPKEYREVRYGDSVITEHVWQAAPDPDDATFLGTYVECHQWVQDHPDGGDYYVTRTGRVIDNGEEAAFFAQFQEE